MPLVDHFQPPLSVRRNWRGFYSSWAVTLADAINECLPADFFVEFQLKPSSQIEVDAAMPPENVSPPTPVAVMPAVFPDGFEVQVFSSGAGPTLVAAIELVSPANKDRSETRTAFTAKCAVYLQRGIGVIVVDIVTSRHANLHDELMALLGHGEGLTFPAPTPLYATAYRPVHRQQRNEIDLWRETLAVGQTLPLLPLAVRGLGCLPIYLEGTYMEARTRGRIG